MATTSLSGTEGGRSVAGDGAALAGGPAAANTMAAPRDPGRPMGTDDRRRCCRQLEQRRPSRRATRGPTAWPIGTEPVADTSGTRSSSTSRSPTSRPPGSAPKPGGTPTSLAGRSISAWQARAVSGVCSRASTPRCRRRPAPARRSTAHTATGKLNAVITPTTPERVPCLHHPVAGPLGGDGAGRRAGATARRRSRRCRSSPALRRAPRR